MMYNSNIKNNNNINTILTFITCTWSAKYEAYTVTGGGDSKAGLREDSGKQICLKVCLKKANDELLLIPY